MNEDELDELLRALPPAPQHWIGVAYEVPTFAAVLRGDVASEDDGYEEDDTGGAEDRWTDTDDAPPHEGDPANEPCGDDPDDPLL